jgi:hypothetical protein
MKLTLTLIVSTLTQQNRLIIAPIWAPDRPKCVSPTARKGPPNAVHIATVSDNSPSTGGLQRVTVSQYVLVLQTRCVGTVVQVIIFNKTLRRGEK